MKALNIESTDQELKDYMLQAESIQHWNELRETIKSFRDPKWIGINIDSSGLIKQCGFTKKVDE